MLVVPNRAFVFVDAGEQRGRFATREDLAAPERTILPTGHATKLAREQLESLGWSVQEDVALRPVAAQ